MEITGDSELRWHHSKRVQTIIFAITADGLFIGETIGPRRESPTDEETMGLLTLARKASEEMKTSVEVVVGQVGKKSTPTTTFALYENGGLQEYIRPQWRKGRGLYQC
jgi:hypothetical protein